MCICESAFEPDKHKQAREANQKARRKTDTESMKTQDAPVVSTDRWKSQEPGDPLPHLALALGYSVVV